MSVTLDQIVEEAQRWPEDAVTELVDRLMVAKHGGLDSATDAAWRSEAHRRLAELESGQVQGVPLEETLAKARAIRGRWEISPQSRAFESRLTQANRNP